MNIVIVSGSKRKGNSEYIAHELGRFIADLKRSINIINISLSDIKLDYCTGCLQCDETSECYINDDMSPLVERIAEADGIVLISPVRWSLISGEMKTFLDRLNPLAMSMKLAGKKCITIVIGQSDRQEGESIVAATDSFKAFADNAGMIVCDHIEIYSCLESNDIVAMEADINKCKEACMHLIENVGDI